ncbi:hypothetical protein WG66_005269, partial [Moniliophthora roreri]
FLCSTDHCAVFYRPLGPCSSFSITYTIRCRHRCPQKPATSRNSPQDPSHQSQTPQLQQLAQEPPAKFPEVFWVADFEDDVVEASLGRLGVNLDADNSSSSYTANVS